VMETRIKIAKKFFLTNGIQYTKVSSGE